MPGTAALTDLLRVRDGLLRIIADDLCLDPIYCEGSGLDDFGGMLRVATAVGEVPNGQNPDAAL